MPSLKLPAFEPLEADRLPELIRSRGPCITIYMPPYRPGEISPRAQRAPLKDFIHVAAQRLGEMRVEESTTNQLLEPLRAFATSIEADKGFHWTRVFFRSQEFLLSSMVRTNSIGNVTVGERFQILPAIGELQIPARFLILKLSKKRVALARAGLRMEPVKLPLKTPETLEEFLELERPDHDLENRGSVGGPAAGRRIRFGTGNERETAQTYLGDFFKAVDRAVREVSRDSKTAPLVLAGVDEDVDLYRSISSHPNVAAGSVCAAMSDTELLTGASALVRAACWRQAAHSLAEAKERFAPARYSTDPVAILNAASSGRVARLFVGTPPQEEDQANRAAIETLRNSGEALLLPRESIPDRTGMAAILRY